MNKFIYETHLHTREASACGSSSGADYIKPYKDLGYSGIFVTDHFFGGNSAVPRNLDWKSRIELYSKGYEAAKEEADKLGDFQVFFGFEQTFDGDDYLVYGLSKEWLIDHPEMEHMRHRELFAAVNSVGGLMIQAHPFRFRQYMHAMYQHPLEVHGIEVYNGGNRPIENQMAALYGKAFDFPITSGSDIHSINFLIPEPGKNPVGGVYFDTPLIDVYDYAKRVKAKEVKIINKEI